MRGGDLADSAGQAAHDQAVGAGAVAEVFHPIEQLAIRDAGGGEEDILRGDQVIHGEDFFEVVAHLAAAAQFVLVARIQLALYLAAHGAQGAGR